jgi:hypothetical protein
VRSIRPKIAKIYANVSILILMRKASQTIVELNEASEVDDISDLPYMSRIARKPLVCSGPRIPTLAFANTLESITGL